MKKMLKPCIAIMCIIVALTGCGGNSDKKDAMAGDMPTMEGGAKSATAVRTSEITRSDISNEYMYSGSITPASEVDVMSTVSGTVASVNFVVGDHVNAGDVLFQMDTVSIQNSINVSKASVASAEAGVKTATTNLELANGSSMQTQIESAKSAVTSGETSVKNAETTLKNSEAALSTAEINLNKAKTDYETNKQLFDVGGISQDSLDSYKNAYDQAQNSYTQSELSLEQAKTSLEQAKDTYNQALTNYDIVANQTPAENIKKAQDSLNSAVASKNSAQAQLKSSEQSLVDATVKAPISGTVLECNVTAGASLGSQTPFVLIDQNTVNVEVNVAEQIISSITAGDEVTISIPTLSNESFSGNITTIAPGANTDGTYTVKVSIPNADGKLKSGMFAQVYFSKSKSANAIVLARSTVISKNDENYVFVVENGVAKKIDVEVGIDNGDEIEVTSGLDDSMRVVVEGQTYLQDGEEVNDVSQDTQESSQTETIAIDNKEE